MLAPLMMTMNAMRRNTPKTLAALSGGEYDPFTKEKGFENAGGGGGEPCAQPLHSELSSHGPDAGAALRLR